MSDSRSTKLIFAACAIAWAAIVLNSAFTAKDASDFIRTVSQEQVQEFARVQLDELQARSFGEGREYCGIIFEDSEGDLGVTRLLSGHEGGCDITFFDMPGMLPVASFHTHGGFSYEYDSEVPSLIDMQSDIAGQMDGFISTPGGRFWRVDWREEAAIQVCGPGCLTQDPQYQPCESLLPEKRYSYPELAARLSRPAGPC